MMFQESSSDEEVNHQKLEENHGNSKDSKPKVFN